MALNLPAVKIFKCQMVYICANMNRFSSCPGGGGRTPRPQSIALDCILGTSGDLFSFQQVEIFYH